MSPKPLKNYRFRVHRLGTHGSRQFQLRVGLEGDKDVEFLPAHRTAFAAHIRFESEHAHEVDAHLELSRFLEWLQARSLLYAKGADAPD